MYSAQTDFPLVYMPGEAALLYFRSGLLFIMPKHTFYNSGFTSPLYHMFSVLPWQSQPCGCVVVQCLEVICIIYKA